MMVPAHSLRESAGYRKNCDELMNLVNLAATPCRLSLHCSGFLKYKAKNHQLFGRAKFIMFIYSFAGNSFITSITDSLHKSMFFSESVKFGGRQGDLWTFWRCSKEMVMNLMNFRLSMFIPSSLQVHF